MTERSLAVLHARLPKGPVPPVAMLQLGLYGIDALQSSPKGSSSLMRPEGFEAASQSNPFFFNFSLYAFEFISGHSITAS